MVNVRSLDLDAFSTGVRDALGFGHYHCVGMDAVGIAAALRSKLLDARTVSTHGEIPHAVILDLRGESEYMLAELPRLFIDGARYLVLIDDIKEQAELALRKREALERRVISIGYRKGCAYYDINPYASLNVAEGCFVAPFERVSDEALQHYNLEVLDEERLLHTDMLRETGRRSDAHCVRYRYAAGFVRPGDRVLDVACGLGYGSRMLYETSQAGSVLGVDLSDFGINYAVAHYGLPGKVEYAVGDAESLNDIADASIDFIAAFETIEHVPHPDRYLQELKRVLAPGGRVMLCAPNDWTDETGNDPNPFHLHVYTWDKLKAEVSSHFLLEKAFVQVAGGAMKCHFSPRLWQEVDPASPEYEEAEWVVFLGMKDPTEPGAAVFKETAWDIPNSSRFNLLAFARDYINPWIVKSMVAIGLRASNPSLLDRFRKKTLADVPSTSVDAGAALCGLVYEQIGSGDFSDRDQLHAAIDRYLAIRRPTPHQRRWQVSLAYAWGLAEFLQQNTAESERYLTMCSDIDPIPYSPILGNKTLDALFLRAVIRVGRKDLAEVRTLLLRSVALVRGWSSGGLKNTWYAAWLNVIGSDSAPLPSGLAEMAVLFDKSARASYMLAFVDTSLERPGAFAREARGFLERQIDQLKAEVRMLEIGNSEKALEAIDLNAGMQRLQQHADSLAEHLVERNQRVEDLAAEVTKQHERSQELAAEVTKQYGRSEELAAEVTKQYERSEELASQVVELDSQAQRLGKELQAEIESRDRIIAELLAKLYP